MTAPKVSVIVPCYNYGRFISETIDSVLVQTFQDYEIIIVDDGSNDRTTPAQIKQETTKDQRIKIITLPKNKGLSVARNAGIQEARGTYILPLDADDKIAPSYLDKATRLIETEHADLVFCHYQCFGERTHTCYMMRDQNKIKAKLPFKNCFAATVLFKKSDWKAFGGFDEGLVAREDWDFWINFAEADKQLVLLDEVLFYYRIHKGSLFHKTENIRGELAKKIKKNHPTLYQWHNYYCTKNYFRYVARPFLLQIHLRKGRRVLRILGIYLIRPK